VLGSFVATARQALVLLGPFAAAAALLHLIERLIHRVRVTTGNLKSLALSDVYGRLVRLLNALVQEVDGKSVVPERLTQQEIADRVGASRDMIGKLMKDLVAGGYLAVEDRTITILKKLPTGW